MRPGVKGTCDVVSGVLGRAFHRGRPPSTMRSASETAFLACAALKSLWMPSRVRSTIDTSAESFTSQSFWGARRMRAPLAPPRLSVPRNVAADAHAVATSCATLSPEPRICSLR